jgi:fluoride ion exporter CrcB/FEX
VFIVNQLGVLIAGYLAYRLSASEDQKLFWIAGFAGGFTTLSSLAFILHGSNLVSGLIYAALSFMCSIAILALLQKGAKK